MYIVLPVSHAYITACMAPSREGIVFPFVEYKLFLPFPSFSFVSKFKSPFPLRRLAVLDSTSPPIQDFRLSQDFAWIAQPLCRELW